MNEYETFVKRHGCKIAVVEKRTLNCNAGAFKNSSIKVSSKWIDKLKEDGDIARQALYYSLSHEICHKRFDFSLLWLIPLLVISNFVNAFSFWLFKCYVIKTDQFIAWCAEVYNDIHSIDFVPSEIKTKDIQIEAMKYKQKHSKFTDRNHPGWNKRIEYVKYYTDFDNAIDAIADELCYINKLIIKIVKHHYLNLNR